MQRFFKDIKKFLNYVTYSTKSELKAEVAGSFLSWLWLLLDPLFFMMVYAFIAILIFRSGEPHFPVFVFIGLNCWQFFSKSVQTSVRTIVSNRTIVTKVYIPKHIFVIQRIGVNAFKMFVSFVLTAVFLIGEAVLNALFGIGLPVVIGPQILMVIPLFALLFLFTFGICLFMTHFGAFVEDLANVTTIVLRLFFYVSGVFYSLENRLAGANIMLAGERVDIGWLGTFFVNANPLALIMSDMRYAVLGNGEGFHFAALIIWTVVAALLCVIGIKTIYKFDNSYVKVI